MNILGINAHHPDASVVLVQNREVIWAAEEERFSRIKHSSGFPELALKKCLQETDLSFDEIQVIAISRDPSAHLWRKISYSLLSGVDMTFVKKRVLARSKAYSIIDEIAQAMCVHPSAVKSKIQFIEHHLAHAACSVLASGFSETAFATIDGLGDFSSVMTGEYHNNRFTIYDRIYYPHSIGFFYTAATQYLGFPHFGDEFKVMGLASYGNPVFYDDMKKIIRLKKTGRFSLDLRYFSHAKKGIDLKWDKGSPEQGGLYSPLWIDLLGPARKKEETLTEHHFNIAASAQKILEDYYDHLLNDLAKRSGSKHLCLAGGVAYNCSANGKIVDSTPFKDVYIPASAGDAGTALGAALYADLRGRKKNKTTPFNPKKMDHAYLGPEYSDDVIKDVLDKAGLKYERLLRDELLQKTASLIANGEIIGWFQGRMEFGPRALGARSILADPRNPQMKDILNKRIKHRESFRPFAPSVIAESALEYFDMQESESPFMLKVCLVKESQKAIIPAVTHVDGTARVQTVRRDQNELYYDLIQEFGRLTGVPMLINTSFNDNEPVVCSPDDAVRCLLATKMDALVIGSYFVPQPTLLEI